MTQIFEASQVLYIHGSKGEACALLEKLWNERDSLDDNNRFRVFCALLEIGAFASPEASLNFLESVMCGLDPDATFWSSLSPAQRACLYDWQAQLLYVKGDRESAFESFCLAVSLGRSDSLCFRILAELYVENGDLDLSVRYARASLQSHRQLQLDLESSQALAIGGFSGEHPLKLNSTVSDYLKFLLAATKLAKSSRNLRSVRELVVEMIHQFPQETRLSQVRMMIERALVQSQVETEATSGRGHLRISSDF